MGELLGAEGEEEGGPGVLCPHPATHMRDRVTRREKLQPEVRPGADFTTVSEKLEDTSGILGGLHGHVVQGQEGLAQLGLFHEPRAGGEGAQKGRENQAWA